MRISDGADDSRRLDTIVSGNLTKKKKRKRPSTDTSHRTSKSQYQIVKKQILHGTEKEFEAPGKYEEPEDEDSGNCTAATQAERDEPRITGVWYEEEDYLRSYPFNETACDTVGLALAERCCEMPDWKDYYNATLTGCGWKTGTDTTTTSPT